MLLCAKDGNLSGVQEELNKGVDINTKDIKYGNTALHYAAWVGNHDIVSFLIWKGGDLSIKNKYGETPYDTAIAGKHEECAYLLATSRK